jgi:polyphosphate:AMP phosphotransferase
MFEAVELGQEVSKKEFEEALPELRTRLVKAQSAFANYPGALIIILNGQDGAGKGEIMNFLGGLMDLRNVVIKTFWQETESQRMRPLYWRYWMSLPSRGHIGFFFGAWYAADMLEAAKGNLSIAEYERQMHRAARYESTLADDGAVILKFWFHLSKKTAKKKLDELKKEYGKGDIVERAMWHREKYDDIVKAAERGIRLTDHSKARWHLIEADSKRHKILKALRIIVEAMETAVASIGVKRTHPKIAESIAPPVLSSIDLSQTAEYEDYKKRLPELQEKLNKLAWAAYTKKRSVIAVFEGWDAAGKGSAIRRIVQGTDIRLANVISVAAPTDEEKGHHYLWRFWRHIPSSGYITIYDRSWYGRVLVERVEKFTSQNDWTRAFEEINEFEENLTESGIILAKFWVHIDQDEQLKRFKEREELPWKQYKITADDWRNREKWAMYESAANEMISRTSTGFAPWNLIAGNDKKYARLRVLEALCRTMEEKL